MQRQNQRIATVRNGGKILIWLGIVIFFVYSYQAIIDLENISHPRRQESFARILTALSKPNLFESEISHQVAEEMWETIQIAFLATSISTVLAIPLTFITTRTSSIWGRSFGLLLQPLLSAIHSVHPLIVVMLTIVIAGIGPTAGVLALTLFSTAVLTVTFSEYARQHASLKWLALLQTYFPGLAFRYLPTCLVIATVLGFMGGGGIGSLVQQYIILLDYRKAGLSLFAIIVVGSSLDLLSRAVWHKVQSTFDRNVPEEISSQV